MLDRYKDELGRIKQWPKKHQMKREVIEYIGEQFEEGISYSEKEVNEIIFKWHTFSDHTMIRRALIDYKVLVREDDGSVYRRNIVLDDKE